MLIVMDTNVGQRKSVVMLEDSTGAHLPGSLATLNLRYFSTSCQVEILPS